MHNRDMHEIGNINDETGRKLRVYPISLMNRLVHAGFVACTIAASALTYGHDADPEFIQSFDTTLEVREDGGLAVGHVIDVHPHGDEIRRGLFFELPNDAGPLSQFSATLAGEPIELEFDDGAVIVAAEEPLAVHRSHRFELRYRADSPWWRESPEAARLRWTPVIGQFELAWRDATLQVVWPESFPLTETPDGGTMVGNRWTRSFQGPLHGEGADDSFDTLSFRANASAIPDSLIRHYGEDWPWRMLLVAGVLALLGFLHGSWRAVGRDPDLGSAPVHRAAPDGLSPAATRFIDRMGFDQTTFVVALASLRFKQALEMSIDEDDSTLQLEQRRGSNAALSPGERAMLDVLFEEADRVELGPGDKRATRASQALEKRLGQEHLGRHFVTNSRKRNWGVALGLMLVALSIVALVVQASDALTPDPWVIGLGFFGLVTGVVAPLVYFQLFKAPTRAGTTAKRQIAGLKRYFEEEATPVTDARQFVKLLPYAAALDCEEAWRDRFDGEEASDLDADTVDLLAWYREFRRQHDCIGAVIPIIAASAATNAAAGASAGASAGGV